jgi:hypothetical protein
MSFTIIKREILECPVDGKYFVGISDNSRDERTISYKSYLFDTPIERNGFIRGFEVLCHISQIVDETPIKYAHLNHIPIYFK